VRFCQGMMGLLSTCRVSKETALTGELPAFFAKEHKNGSPVGSLIIAGCIATAMTLASSLLAGSAETVFWSIFSCTSFLLLIPYLINFEAYLKLKRTDKTTPRPYTFPGPSWLAVLFARIGELVIVATMFLFIWVPGTDFDVQSGSFVLIGILVTLGVGEVIVRKCIKNKQKAGGQINQ